MRIYIMTDLEGVCGVTDSENWCHPNSRYYERGKELLTAEVNAAVDGFLDAGAKEVVVADGHGPGAVAPERLHPAARLARNWGPKPYPFSLDDGHFDAAAWVGQHAKSGSILAHLAHTGSFGVRDLLINGISMGEFGVMVLCASALDVPVIFAAGDEAFTKEARALVPGIETVAVKRGLTRTPGHALPAAAYAKHNLGAIHLSIEHARAAIRAGAKRALERYKSERFGLISVKPPFRLVQVLRSDESNPPRIARAEHPESVIELLNAPRQFYPIEQADPMAWVEEK